MSAYRKEFDETKCIFFKKKIMHCLKKIMNFGKSQQ